MRSVLPERLERGRFTAGRLASDSSYGPEGAFRIQGPCGEELTIIASNGQLIAAHGWEHVSVSLRRRNPNWQEMCFVKDLFWDDAETVIQFHPAKLAYVNNHPHCLHLWRHAKDGHPLPPALLVGIKELGVLT
jgi:hypothetical protein